MTASPITERTGTKTSASPLKLETRPQSLSAPRPLSVTALRAPLVIKIAGANVLACLVLVAVVAPSWSRGVQASTLWTAALIAVTLHLVLAAIALRPLRGLETVVARVRHGDFGARTIPSSIADGDVARIASMLNDLLDELNADRARVRALAAEVIRTGDRERSALAHELHDSTAQHLAALLYQLSAVARDVQDRTVSDRLLGIREVAGDVLEEVRTIARTVYPHVLDDLGLAAALRYLARETSHTSGLRIAVEAAGTADVPAPQAAVLYSIAQAAVRNALKHSSAEHVELRLTMNKYDVVVEIVDDGRGFDVAEAERRRPGMGLLMMRERAALLNGSVEIWSALGKGTRVIATVPLSTHPPTVESRNVI
jgi:two-component system, NarL family, sensor histidine kinase UhpB